MRNSGHTTFHSGKHCLKKSVINLQPDEEKDDGPKGRPGVQSEVMVIKVNLRNAKQLQVSVKPVRNCPNARMMAKDPNLKALLLQCPQCQSQSKPNPRN